MARLHGDTVNVSVGGNLNLVSPQDWSRTRGYRVAGSVLIGPDSFSYGQTTGDRNWTEMSEILGRGATTVTVGGNLKLAGSTVASETNALNLSADTLTWSNTIDRDSYQSTSFGVSGLSGIYGRATGQASTGPDGTGQIGAAGTSLLGGVTFTNQTDREEGVTFAVIGEGQVRIGDAIGAEVLGGIHRDIAGRQIVTLSQHDRTTIDIPLVNLQQLSANATSAANLFRALTTPIPEDVAAQGPAAADYFQRLVANGLSADEAKETLATPQFQKLTTMQTEFDKAIEAYGSAASIPPGVRAAIADGMTLDYTGGLPRIVSECATSGAGCQFSIINPQGIEQARVLVRNAENALIEKLPEFVELSRAFARGATPAERVRYNVLQAEIEDAAKTYALCAADVERPPLWAVAGDYNDVRFVRAIFEGAADFAQKKDTYYSGRADTADEIFALIPPLAYSRGFATLASVVQNGVRSFVTEGGELLSREAVDQLVRTGLAYVDRETGELVVRQSSEAFLSEMAKGRAREALVGAELRVANPGANIQREVYLRTADGEIARDAAGNARRIDFAVIENGQVTELREVTSLTANKNPQTIKETAIRQSGGVYVRDRNTNQLIDISNVPTRLDRRP